MICCSAESDVHCLLWLFHMRHFWEMIKNWEQIHRGDKIRRMESGWRFQFFFYFVWFARNWWGQMSWFECKLSTELRECLFILARLARSLPVPFSCVYACVRLWRWYADADSCRITVCVKSVKHNGCWSVRLPQRNFPYALLAWGCSHC